MSTGQGLRRQFESDTTKEQFFVDVKGVKNAFCNPHFTVVLSAGSPFFTITELGIMI